jgi:F-type H+-transporting ATPase subunit a
LKTQSIKFQILTKKYAVLFLTIFLLFGKNFSAFAVSGHSDEDENSGFNAGDLIMHHILDAHEIHIFSLNAGTDDEKHFTIPLPIILYDQEDKKLISFMSSKFNHGHDAYKGYKIDHEKIYKLNEVGELDYDENHHATNYMPLDFSITKTVTGILLTSILLLLIFISVAKKYTANPNSAPKGLQSLIEPLVLFVRDDIAKPSIGHKYQKYLPFLLTVFFFIWIANLLGLIPFIGGFNVTGNIAIALVLAVFTFIITIFSGNKDYWMHILWTPGVPWWLKFPIPLMFIIEFIGFISKPIVLTLRLFANITAGHIIILAFISLIFIFSNLFGTAGGYGVSVLSVGFSIFMFVIELLVAFLQAYVFTLLSAIYFGSAVEEHHH